jgi:CubicO group peptidase (beta-lactamase class C family)
MAHQQNNRSNPSMNSLGDGQLLELQSLTKTLISTACTESKAPSIFVCIALNGSIVVSDCIGHSSASRDSRPVSIDDRLMIGSISKAITSTVIAKIVETRKISWTTRISDLFPDIKQKYSHPSVDAMIFQLLCHYSGLGTGQVFQNTENPQDWRIKYTESMIQTAIGSPGEKFFYTGGAATAASMAERVCGETFEALTERLLCKPLGITSLGWGKPWEASYPSVHGTVIKDGRLIDSPKEWNGYIKSDPAGGIHCSIKDLSKFGILHSIGERSSGFLNQATFRKLHSEPYGDGKLLGWFNNWDNRGWWIQCSGSTGLGDHSTLYVDPNSGTVISVYANLHSQDGGEKAVTSVANGLKTWISPYRTQQKFKPHINY